MKITPRAAWAVHPLKPKPNGCISLLYSLNVHEKRCFDKTLFMQNEPKCMLECAALNASVLMAYSEHAEVSASKNEPKTNPNEPKRTQIVSRSVAHRHGFWVLFLLF